MKRKRNIEKKCEKTSRERERGRPGGKKRERERKRNKVSYVNGLCSQSWPLAVLMTTSLMCRINKRLASQPNVDTDICKGENSSGCTPGKCLNAPVIVQQRQTASD